MCQGCESCRWEECNSSDRTDTADDQMELHNVIEQETAVAVIIVSAVIAVRIIA